MGLFPNSSLKVWRGVNLQTSQDNWVQTQKFISYIHKSPQKSLQCLQCLVQTQPPIKMLGTNCCKATSWIISDNITFTRVLHLRCELCEAMLWVLSDNTCIAWWLSLCCSTTVCDMHFDWLLCVRALIWFKWRTRSLLRGDNWRFDLLI